MFAFSSISFLSSEAVSSSSCLVSSWFLSSNRIFSNNDEFVDWRTVKFCCNVSWFSTKLLNFCSNLLKLFVRLMLVVSRLE